jgi:hypothetical protein
MAEEEKKKVLPPWTIPVLCILILCLLVVYEAVTKQVAVEAAYKECNEFYQSQFAQQRTGFELPANLSLNISIGGPP